MFTSWSATFQRCIHHAEGVLSAPKRDVITRYKGIQRNSFVSEGHIPRYGNQSHFFRDSTLGVRRSAPNQYFSMFFLWNHVKFHGKTENRYEKYPKCNPKELNAKVTLDYKLDPLIYNSRAPVPWDGPHETGQEADSLWKEKYSFFRKNSEIFENLRNFYLETLVSPQTI